MEQEERIGCIDDGFTLVNQQGRVVAVLQDGDTVELFIGNRWQRVRVRSGGYKGWYYVMTDGQMARFALSMLAQGYQAGMSSVAAPASEQVPQPAAPHRYRSSHRTQRVRRTKRHEGRAVVETLPSGVQVQHPVSSRRQGKEPSA